MYRGRGVLLTLALSGVALAQPTVAIKVEVDPIPALERLASRSQKGVEEKGALLIEALFNEVRTNGAATVIARGASDKALDSFAKPHHLGDSNKRLGEFADKASAMYGVHVLVSLDPAKGRDSAVYYVLKVKWRVVRRDGELSIEETEKSARLEKTDPNLVLSKFKVLAHEIASDIAQRALSSIMPAPLPTGLSSVGQSKEADSQSKSGEASHPPPPPPLVQVSEPHFPFRPVGYASLCLGGAALVAGIVAFAMAPGFRTNSDGFVVRSDIAQVSLTQDRQRTGVALMATGGVVAAAGAVLLLLGPPEELHARGAVMPITGGASFVLGGRF